MRSIWLERLRSWRFSFPKAYFIVDCEKKSETALLRMKPLFLVATIMAICCMALLSTVPTVSGQFAPPVVIPASNNNGIGALLLSLVLLGAILFNTFGDGDGEIKLNVNNEGNAKNLANSETNSNSTSDAYAYASSG